MIQVVEESKKPEKAKPEYKQVNGWTNPLPCWQIFAIGLMFIIEILNFYLIHKIIDLGFILLYVLEGISFIFLVLIIIYFFMLTFSDPSDPRLKDPSYSQPNQKLTKCYGCMVQVSQNSHHCIKCKRCVDNFDHHCVFLNNCIGAQNYPMFWKFLVWMMIHMAIGMTIGLIIFLEDGGWVRWLALVFVILQFTVFVEVAVLATFHCYIGLCLYKTTLQVLRGDKKSKVAPETQPTTPQTPRQSHTSKIVSIRPSQEMNDKIVESPEKQNKQDPHESTEVGFKYGSL